MTFWCLDLTWMGVLRFYCCDVYMRGWESDGYLESNRIGMNERKNKTCCNTCMMMDGSDTQIPARILQIPNQQMDTRLLDLLFVASGIVIGASHLIPIGVRGRSFLHSSGRIFGGFRHVTCTSVIAGYGDPPDAPNRCHQIPIDIMNQLDCICRPWKYRYLARIPSWEPKKTTHQIFLIAIRIRTWSRRRG